MNIVNLTKHRIKLGKNGHVVNPSGHAARILWAKNPKECIRVEGQDIEKVKIGPDGAVLELPRPKDDTILIVSPELRMFLTLIGEDRPDVVSSYSLSGAELNKYANALTL